MPPRPGCRLSCSGPQETVDRAPDLVDPVGCIGGLLFRRDGTARAQAITVALQERALSAGVRFVHERAVQRISVGGQAPLTVHVHAELAEGAELPWRAGFEEVVDRALRLLPVPQRFTVDTRLNGVFAMTADNRPLLEPVAQVPGLWIAQALWVTHAAGAAQCLVRVMTGTEPLVDGLDALLPGRFAGRTDGS